MLNHQRPQYGIIQQTVTHTNTHIHTNTHTHTHAHTHTYTHTHTHIGPSTNAARLSLPLSRTSSPGFPSSIRPNPQFQRLANRRSSSYIGRMGLMDGAGGGGGGGGGVGGRQCVAGGFRTFCKPTRYGRLVELEKEKEAGLIHQAGSYHVVKTVLQREKSRQIYTRWAHTMLLKNSIGTRKKQANIHQGSY